MAWLLFTLMFGAATIAVAIVLVLIAVARSGRSNAAPTLTSLASSIVFEVSRGGTSGDGELRRWMRNVGLVPVDPVTIIDLASWAEAYSQRTTESDHRRILELSVRGAMLGASTLTSRQFHALQDLVFSLGYHADTIQRLREQFEFDYIDYAKERRPREADRASAVKFFNRNERISEDLALLGFREMPTRQELISSYRRLVRENHPDTLHASGGNEDQAASKFIMITAAYERLLKRTEQSGRTE